MNERSTKPIRHRTASQLGLETRKDERRLERAGTSPFGHPVKRASPTALENALSDRVVDRFRQYENELTPPPVDTNEIPRVPSPEEAWEHADNVNKRTVDLLAAIAESSGAGMRVGDDLRGLQRKLRTLRWVVVAILIPTCSALLAIGLKLYSKGYDDGIAAGWRKSVDERIERLERGSARRDDSAPRAPWGMP